MHVMTRQDVADHVGGCIQNTRLRLLKGYRKIELGAQEIPRAAYHMRLERALRLPARIDFQPVPQPQDVVQRMTQTS